MLKVVRREGCGGGRFWKGAWQHLVLLALTLKYFIGSGMRDLFLTNSKSSSLSDSLCAIPNLGAA